MRVALLLSLSFSLSSVSAHFNPCSLHQKMKEVTDLGNVRRVLEKPKEPLEHPSQFLMDLLLTSRDFTSVHWKNYQVCTRFFLSWKNDKKDLKNCFIKSINWLNWKGNVIQEIICPYFINQTCGIIERQCDNRDLTSSLSPQHWIIIFSCFLLFNVFCSWHVLLTIQNVIMMIQLYWSASRAKSGCVINFSLELSFF